MFFISLLLSLLFGTAAVFINLPWIADLSDFMGVPLAYMAIFGIAIIPGIMFVFYILSLISHRVKKCDCVKITPAVTVIIPAYNAQESIRECVDSVIFQDYGAPVSIIVANDGSVDDTEKIVSSMARRHENITLLSLPHRGKSYALNSALSAVTTEYFVTVDSDTVLHKTALYRIMKRLVCGGFAAVAGSLFVKNKDAAFICKMQVWDYSLGIFAIKFLQGVYKSTLVAQGAFSAYKTADVVSSGGWQDTVGEDIVLTFCMLGAGKTTSFEHTAIAFTEVPEDVKSLLRQRKRWARGMIEGFKRNKRLLRQKNLKAKSRILMSFNLLFPFVDFVISIFLPIGLLLCLFGIFAIVGPLTLMLIPLTLIMTFIVDRKMKKACRQAGYRMPRRSFLAFLAYLLAYQLMLSPICFLGYLQEALYEEKSW